MPKKKPSKKRPLLTVLHIYCEGEKTEPNYIEKYLCYKTNGERRRKVIRVEPTKKNTPVQIVEAAINHKNSQNCPDDDVFWVVYDREATSKYTDQLHRDAFDKAKANNINVALSNVCFELWILLHFKQNTAPYTDYDNLMATSDLKKELSKVGVDYYEKGNADIFKVILAEIGNARNRAKEMNKLTIASAAKNIKQPYQLNPYTDVHLLLDAIDDFM
jgi:RloB-like protein